MIRVWPILLLAAGIACGCPKYVRDSYNYGIDEDRDCQYTRAEVLVRDNKGKLTFRDGRTCTVDSGSWYDPYTDKEYLAASDLEIDHVVALSEAHKSGAWAWAADRKREYGNSLKYPFHLMAVQGKTNSSKGDSDPSRWLPPNTAYHIEYAKIWVTIKTTWGLKADKAEIDALKLILGGDTVGLALPDPAPEDLCTDVVSMADVRPNKRHRRVLAFPYRIDGRMESAGPRTSLFGRSGFPNGNPAAE